MAYADKRAGQRLEPMDERFASWRRRYPRARSWTAGARAGTKPTWQAVRARASRLEADVCRAAGIAPADVRRLAWTGPRSAAAGGAGPRHEHDLPARLVLGRRRPVGATRAVDRLGARALAAETGAPLERWELRGSLDHAAAQVAQSTSGSRRRVMFGGGTLAVVTGSAPLAKTTERREELDPRRSDGRARATRLVFLEADDRPARRARPRRSWSTRSTAAGGEVRRSRRPKAGSLTGWIENEARERASTSAPARPRSSPSGSALRHAGRRRPPRQDLLAAGELDEAGPLPRRRRRSPSTTSGPSSPEAIPASIWAFIDAVGERQRDKALDAAGPAARRDARADPDDGPPPADPRAARDRRPDRVGRAPAGGGARRWAINSRSGRRPWPARPAAGRSPELQAALEGVLELDAMVKGAPDTGAGRGAASAGVHALGGRPRGAAAEPGGRR